ncbi:MAG: hypothetical protein QOH49_2329 [Acidobacteriota bacterium]|jgi:hypothetical protein|nr:hypothetical protein [Acidobacteriota bacterium]
MIEELITLHLRHCAAGESEAELVAALEAEIRRLTDSVGEWSRRVGGVPLRRHPGHFVKDCDEAITHALHACARRDYATACESLRQAHGALVEVRAAWQANSAYDEAFAAHKALAASAPSDLLKTLLTLHNLALLLDETGTLLERGKYRQAHLLALACRRRCETLLARADDVPAELDERARQLASLCDEAARFLPGGRDDWADGAALAAVGTLLREHRCVLAEHLLSDLEVELKPHRTFLDLYRQLGPVAQDAVVESDLREMIAAESWSAATSRILLGVLGVLSGRLADATARAVALQQQIAAYSATAVAQ